MRTSLALVAFTTIGAVASVAHAQDAPPPPPPAQAGPPPGAMPPPQPGPPPDVRPSGEEERTANNALYVEGLGPAIFYSINYDRTFGDFSARVGFEYLSMSITVPDANGGLAQSSASILGVPITVSYLGIGSKKHMLELGTGATVFHFGAGASALGAESSESKMIIAPTAIVGYRMQPPDGGFLLRAGLSPWFFKAGDVSLLLPMPYIALGGTF